MKENIIKSIQRLVYIILLFICMVCLYFIYTPLALVILTPICAVIWIISGKSYYETILDFPDKLYYTDEYLIKLLRINK